MVWKSRLFAAITHHFCKPQDHITVKRKQCIHVTSATLLLAYTLLRFIAAAFSKFKFIAASSLFFLAVCVCIASLVHCRITRRHTSYRLMLLVIVGLNFYSKIRYGGFAYIPQLIMGSFAAPMLAIFLAPNSIEVLAWYLLWMLGNVVVWTLQLHHLLPAVTENVGVLQFYNTLALYFYTTFYLLFLWSIANVYNAETACRHLLEAELHVLVRLSNEIRNPITIISGITELINEWTNVTDEQKFFISDLGVSARRLATVVNDLLAFSNYKCGDSSDSGDSGDHQGSLIDFSLRDAVDAVIGYHLPQAEKSRLQIYTDIPADLPIELHGDKQRVVGILDHLLSNAIKFTPCGSVTVEVPVLTSSL